MSAHDTLLSDDHAQMLAESTITAAHAAARGYETITDPVRLDHLQIAKAARNTPGLLVPMLRVDGSVWGYQYRPDRPRLRNGSVCKYETPTGQANGLDIPPGVGPQLADPDAPLWITEGVKKSDAGALAGLCIVGLVGVWNWMCTNTAGGKVALPEWRDVALNGRRVIVAFDGDVARKEQVQKAAKALASYLATKGATIEYLHLPDADDKTGLDDYLGAGHTVDDLWRLVKPHQPRPAPPKRETPAKVPAVAEPARPATVTLPDAHNVFKRWLGDDYDVAALDAVLAAAAVERLDGDPLWLLLISGSGNAKTETVGAFGDVATITSTVTSVGALLSASSQKEQAADATGGLLRQLGERGVLVIKDVTSILSMNRELRGEVLAALREVYDGEWHRNVGTDGGRTLSWRGRLAVIGAVTTAWDKAHAVIASMGDRFVLVRMDSASADNRRSAGRQALRNTGRETQMRAELAAAAAGVLAGMDLAAVELTDDENDVLFDAANVVTLCRTAVETDYRGDVIDAHAPEMPTRFAKQLAQIVRGAVALGAPRDYALALAIRCARDSMPPLRLAILDDVAAHPESSTSDVRKRLELPRMTVDRQLQALHILGVLVCDEDEAFGPGGERQRTRWLYSVAGDVDPAALAARDLAAILTGSTETVPEMSVSTPDPIEEGLDSQRRPRPPGDVLGTNSVRVDPPTAPVVNTPGRRPGEWLGSGEPVEVIA